ncbi:MAG: hypothetical protein WB586_15535 [Chthoniobacterales bacterium]
MFATSAHGNLERSAYRQREKDSRKVHLLYLYLIRFLSSQVFDVIFSGLGCWRPGGSRRSSAGVGESGFYQNFFRVSSEFHPVFFCGGSCSLRACRGRLKQLEHVSVGVTSR